MMQYRAIKTAHTPTDNKILKHCSTDQAQIDLKTVLPEGVTII